MKLANLKMISPMTNLPKGYKKQLDKDSEELLRIFYSVSYFLIIDSCVIKGGLYHTSNFRSRS